MEISFSLRGVEEALAEYNPDVVDEAVNEALGTLGTYLATPRGSGLGVRRNTLSFTVTSGLLEVSSTLNWPRTRGIAWSERARVEANEAGAAAIQAAAEKIAAALR